MQGSTYKKAIINVKDINQNFKSDERTKLFYTAVTRASDLVILYNN
jgi:ATP-dependent exoDNAse (exonuclease V) alpha subunit